MIDLLRTLLLTAHLLAGALAGAGPLVVAGLRLSSQLRQEGDPTLRRVVTASIASLVVTLLVGLASLGVVWLAPGSGYRDAALRFPAGAWGMLAAEWLFSLVLYGVYWGLWNKLRERPIVHGLIALVAATNLLYHFPTIMVVLGAVADNPAVAAGAQITRPVFLETLASPALLAKSIHFMAISLLVAGAAVAWAATRDGARRTTQAGGLAGLAALVVTMLTGVVALVQLAAGSQRALLGGDAGATAAFALAIAASLGVGQALMPLALGEPEIGAARRATLLVALATMGMAWAGLRAPAI